MADRAREKGRTERYLPKKAWASMTKEERTATDEKKKRAKTNHPSQRKETKIPLEEAKPLPGHSSNLYLLLSCHLPLCTFCEKGRCGNLPPFDSICLSYGRAQETSQQPKCKYWRAGNVSCSERCGIGGISTGE